MSKKGLTGQYQQQPNNTKGAKSAARGTSKMVRARNSIKPENICETRLF